MSDVSFGIFDHIERTSGGARLHELYDERLGLMEAADRAGFWCYHVAEHHATPLGMAPSPSLLLAAAAQRTRRMRLGALVYLLPFYQPLRLVEEICMLDNLTGGRLEVGVGRGVSPFELGHHRIPFYTTRNIYNEAMEVIVKGLRNERLTHSGRLYEYDNVPMELRPMQSPHPAFWYGIISDDSTAYAARLGMNVVSLGPDELVKRLSAVYRATGRDRAADLNPHVERPRVGALRHIVIADDEREAEQLARDAYRVFYDNAQKLWRDFLTIVLAFTPDYDAALKQGTLMVGTPPSVREQVGRFFDESGCDYLVLSFAWGNLSAAQARRSLDAFASGVMPEFAGRRSDGSYPR
jgi:alkanesulfonate monooxygenase SsuD/methylene tetrahydromethanopterin reductase-like flavin-dependent oxidoreductase (luciferase family)